jgi:signal transduction histidine kinase
MAKKGLLQAVTQMAEKISVVDGVHISVLDYGLETRLENSVELTLFRIIQELITNVIKHTEATEVNIHITNHGESLNILVEDNGKGFEVKNMATNKGMGLRSIDKRIASLNGSLDIESAPGTGTVVIIDIPI